MKKADGTNCGLPPTNIEAMAHQLVVVFWLGSPVPGPVALHICLKRFQIDVRYILHCRCADDSAILAKCSRILLLHLRICARSSRCAGVLWSVVSHHTPCRRSLPDQDIKNLRHRRSERLASQSEIAFAKVGCFSKY